MLQGLRTTEYVLLNQRVGWRAGALDGVVVDAGSGQLRLQTLPNIDRPLVDAQGDFGGLVLPISIAEDCEGRIYILDAQTLLVKRFDPCQQAFEVLPALGGAGGEARRLLDPHRITISERNDLYVADTGNRRVQVFALKGLGLRAIWGPLRVIEDESGVRVRRVQGKSTAIAGGGGAYDDTEDEYYDTDFESDAHPGGLIYPRGTWQPWDVAVSGRNWAYVSDYTNGLIHVFDAQGQWRTAFPGAGAKDDQPRLEKPTFITLDKQGHIYIIQEGKTYVTVLDADGTFLQQVQKPDEVQDNFCPLSLAVDEEGNIYLCDGTTRRLYYYCRAADGTFATPAVCQSFYCMGTALIFDRSGNPLLLDAKQQKVLVLKTAVLYQDTGAYVSCALDSNIYNCQWHRVLLSATLDPGTSITVATFTSESSRSIEEIQNLLPERWQTNLVDNQVGCGEWDCLVLSQPGRYLWLRLTFTGEGTTTPTIEQIRVYFPRLSSLQYLPATYSEDPESRDFLDRFLSLFDTMRGSIAQQITDIASYFDPASAPIAPIGQPQQQDFLPWLASWIGLTVDRHWPDQKKRQLVRQAVQLYRLRGTAEGLRQHIRLYLDAEPYIVEHFKLRRWLFLDSARLGDQSALWGKGIMDRLQLDEHAQIGSFQLLDTGDPVSDPFYHYAHQFTIFIPIRQQCDPTQQQTLQRIIEMAKPAHTVCYLQVVQPRFRIGIQSVIGIDSVLERYPDRTVMGEGKLGYETVLGPSQNDEPPTMRIGERSRVGSSTVID
jgi:phage tail-like protein